ncbi:hypothetical protein [Erythrobacter sp. EC-HK427]|nr:hypothetical protein [Erythrobacter sp. EC-HK427]VVT02571.1 conserved hypothetical protein [Erythrobacter sp. EC-HK427]
MAKAIAFTRSRIAAAQDTARALIVSFCAIALIVAGQAAPF